MLYKSLFQLYPDNFQNNYFLLSDKLEDIRYSKSAGWNTIFILRKYKYSDHFPLRSMLPAVNRKLLFYLVVSSTLEH